MIKLIPNWKDSWKFSSMWATGAGILISAADLILSSVPIGYIHGVPHGKSIILILFGLVLIGRITKKKGKPDGCEE